MKKSNDTIHNRTRDFQACNAVPQPTALRRRPPPPHPPKKTNFVPYKFSLYYTLLYSHLFKARNLI